MRSLFLLGREQDRRNDAVELRAPPDDTVFVASSLGYPLESRNVSTILPNPRGSFLACSFALYRALVAGLRVTAMAVRHSRDRGGKKEVERPRVVAMESQGRCGADAHPGVGSNLTSDGRCCGRAAVREEGGADGWGYPVSVPQREGEGGSDERNPPVSDHVRGRERAQRPRGPSGSGSACGPISRPLAAQWFFFFFYAVFALYLILCKKNHVLIQKL